MAGNANSGPSVRAYLTDEQEEFLRAYMRCGWLNKSAKIAGLKPKDVCEWLADPTHPVKKELERRKDLLRNEAVYEAATAMSEAKQAMEFAEETGNANAFGKAVELRAKLSGLLVDKVDARLLGAFTVNIEGIADPTKEQIAVQVVQALMPPKPPDDDESDNSEDIY